jgi:hypothetical protein
MDGKELGALISRHVSVPHTFADVVDWAQKADGVALKADAVVYLKEHRGLVAIAYVVNKSDCSEAVLGSAAMTEAGGMVISQAMPAELALSRWQPPEGLTLEPMSFARLAMFFPAPQWIRDRYAPAHRSDSQLGAIKLEIELLGRSDHLSDQIFVYTPEELRRFDQSRWTATNGG